MTYRFKAFGLAIDACWWTCAGEASAVGFGIGALEAMVFGKVVSGTKWADNGVFRVMAILDVVA